MKIHIIGTVNGLTNEGMRNVATHIANCFAQQHKVTYSGLKELWATMKYTRQADVTLVFARANTPVYWLLRMVERLCPNTWMVCVQQPMSEFLDRNNKRTLRCNYLYLSQSDMNSVKLSPNCVMYGFQPGINTVKFTPVDEAKRIALKQKYGFRTDRPLVVHVGHCSAGRGLESFCALKQNNYERLVVASGMFEDASLVSRLEADGIRIHRGYLEHIEEIYQMADVYLFPTCSTEFVISIPLSVMEALACGTPVVGYHYFHNLSQIDCVPNSLILLEGTAQLPQAVETAARVKCNASLLRHPESWEDSAQRILDFIRSNMK